ncbi:MAG: alpha-L-fucosidase [Spirosomataceae bacterium]
MKKWILTFALLSSLLTAFAQKDYLNETKEARDARMNWWRDATFGMFIHWGVYSIPAGLYHDKPIKGIGEWIMHSANIPVAEYEGFAKQFNPTQFNAKEWVRVAKEAGIKYIVITSKHHDGFCLWDSKVSNYDIMDFAPFKRDILKELTEACKAAGIRMCFYHSIMDWHQPDAESPKDYKHQNNPNANWATYRETYLKPQLTELVKTYDPGVLWFDGEWIPEWTEPQGKDLYNFLRNLNPNLIINNRVGKGRKGMQGMNRDNSYVGDFGTPEQEILEGTSDQDWESCMTMNDTWGFRKDDNNWKSSTMLIHNLIDVAAKGGNYLLNIGPTAEGLIPTASVERLGEMGKWLKINGEAIYGTKSLKHYKEGDNLKFTVSKDGKNIYAILTNKSGNTVTIKSITPKAGSAIHLLGVTKPLSWTANAAGSITVTLPDKLPCEHAWVLKISGTAN